jgi:hypothetical protein
VSRGRIRQRFKPGDLIDFRHGKEGLPPAVIINVNVKMGPWNKYFTFDIFIPDFGVVKDIDKRDIKKWKQNAA